MTDLGWDLPPGTTDADVNQSGDEYLSRPDDDTADESAEKED